MEDYPLLARVDSPEDLRKLSLDELELACAELRRYLWDTINAVGGHLAASLGVVELTAALHYVYNTPEDRLVWDVGHQGYIHKILTGRRDKLPTIRSLGGISGFLKRNESEYDTFGAGHASTSLSAAYGMAVARDMKGEGHSVVSVIGDGGMTGGLAFEALNNAGHSGRDFTIILNDNRMSISPNVGAVPKFLAKMETNPLLARIKDEMWDLMGKSPVGAKTMRDFAGRFEASLKGLVSPGMLFEEFGFQYFGPFDGHNVREAVEILRNIKASHKHPVIVHFLTRKGKGYDVAEADSVTWHAVKTPAKVEPKPEANAEPEKEAYMNIFGKAVIQEAKRDSRVCVITAAMKEGTGLVEFAQECPQQFFDVGIAEGHAVTFAAGLAAEGMRPIAAIYSTFLQRAYDHVLHDCGIQHLPVLLCMDRGGLVGEDGPTHHGCYDLGYLSTIPGIVVCAPRDGQELRNLIHTGLHWHDGPFAVRYPRDKAPDHVRWDEPPALLKVGSWEVLREGKKVAVLAVGTMVEAARKVILAEEYNVTLVNCRFVKPMDDMLLEQLLDSHDAVLTIEEGTAFGGFGSQVAMYLKSNGHEHLFHALHLPDSYIEHGSRTQILEVAGLSPRHISEAINGLLRAERPTKQGSAPKDLITSGPSRGDVE